MQMTESKGANYTEPLGIQRYGICISNAVRVIFQACRSRDRLRVFLHKPKDTRDRRPAMLATGVWGLQDIPHMSLFGDKRSTLAKPVNPRNCPFIRFRVVLSDPTMSSIFAYWGVIDRLSNCARFQPVPIANM